MKTNAYILTIILLSVLVGEVYSQSENNNNSSQFTLYASFGVQLPEYSKLNNLLKENSYSEFEQINYATNGGFYLFYPKSKLSVLGNVSGFSQNITNLNTNTSIEGTGIGASLGYTFFSDKQIQLTPYLGSEFSWINISIIDDVSTNSTFINYLKRPFNQNEMSATNLLANIGIIGKTAFIIDKNSSNKLVLGIRTGFSTPISKTIWTVHETKLNDGPAINSGGFYAGIIFGLEF
ncbi:MAG: hypothetical protein PHZ24_11360 [Bacteroidales bacterium]|nr:hypothetical protein [Bacteroidales bacterium]MDY0143376.1 hypothetical protein [Bacteroidales bacterium]